MGGMGRRRRQTGSRAELVEGRTDRRRVGVDNRVGQLELGASFTSQVATLVLATQVMTSHTHVFVFVQASAKEILFSQVL